MFGSVEAMLSASADKPLWRAVLEDDCQDRDADPAASLARMGRLWQAMKESLEEYDPARRSASGLSGGQGARMADLADPICGSFVQEVASVALKLGEHNACMGRIVAAPTAGACGVLPAVLIPLQRREGLSDETMVECLYVSAGFGQVIAQRASISGAEGGCQAEVGSASAMAAAGVLADLLQGRENPYAALFDPARTVLRPQLLANGLEAVLNLLRPTAPRCPHMGCALRWNGAERSWDCPCHGSRFGADGTLLNNPASSGKPGLQPPAPQQYSQHT